MIEISDNKNFCVATVTTDSFIVGTLVTIYSFLKHNSWFKGEIVIIFDELSEQNREFLGLIYNKIIFLKVSDELKTRVEKLAEDLPEFLPKQARFFSLEIFRLRNYAKVLFLDSDLLFRGSVEDLFALENNFIACGDGAFYNRCGRRWGSGIENEKEIHILYNTFNSGLFLVDDSLLTDKIYSGILELVDKRIYKTPNMMLADQVVLNLYFAGRQHIVSGKYNFLLVHHKAIYGREKIGLQDALVVHFNGRQKPWLAEEVLQYSLENSAFAKACGFWFESYAECLQKLFLAKNTKNLYRTEI